MTVKELKESLNKYADDTEVIVTGGENEYGEWAQLEVGHYGKIPYYCKGEIKYSKEEFFITEAVLMGGLLLRDLIPQFSFERGVLDQNAALFIFMYKINNFPGKFLCKITTCKILKYVIYYNHKR